MDKKKAKDPQIWKRLGLELAALHDLIVEIQCDKDYASVMDKALKFFSTQSIAQSPRLFPF